MFDLLPRTHEGLVLDVLLLIASVVIGRVMRSRLEALALAYGAGVLTHLVAQMLSGPIVSPTCHVVPRLLLGMVGVCLGRLLAILSNERLRIWVQRRPQP